MVSRNFLFTISILITSKLVAQPQVMSGFPIHAIPTGGYFDLRISPEFSSPIVFDITQDGQKDIVVTGRRDIWVFDATHSEIGSPLLHFHLPDNEDSAEFTGPATLAFPTSDGLPWIVIGASRPDFFQRTVSDDPDDPCDWTNGHSHCPQAQVYPEEVHPHGPCQHFFSRVYAARVDGPSWEWYISEEIPMRLATAACEDVNSGIYLACGDLNAQYTIFRSSMVALEGGSPMVGAPVIKFDHCTVESSGGYFIAYGTEIENSYMRNCVFRDLGLTWDFGSMIVLEGDIEISDCWFYNNQGFGIGLLDARDTEIDGCNIISNGMTGLYSEGVVATVDVNCTEISYNGGDSTAEVFVFNGCMDFSNDAGCIFADNSGPLLEAPEMSCLDIDSGGNGFYLFDSAGTYILTGDETDTMMVRGNFWYPWTPDTSAFQDYFDPDTSRFWNWSNPVEELASCESGLSSMPGGGEFALVRPTEGTFSMPGRNNKTRVSSVTKLASKTSSDASQRQAVDLSSYEAGTAAQQIKAYSQATSRFAEFIDNNTDDPTVVSALSHHIVSSIKARQTDGLASYYERVAQRSLNRNVQRTAKFFRLEALALEGRPQEAVSGYDEIMTKPASTRDSVEAVVNAMQVLFRDRESNTLSTRYPENRITDPVVLVQRMSQLLKPLLKHNRTLDAEHETEAVPTSYMLYQNYPNPFNPITEIRFDIPDAVRVELKVFNILGQEVMTLVDDVRAAGAYRILWDGKNAGGLSVASGVYVYQLKSGDFQDAKKMVLIR